MLQLSNRVSELTLNIFEFEALPMPSCFMALQHSGILVLNEAEVSTAFRYAFLLLNNCYKVKLICWINAGTCHIGELDKDIWI